MWGPEVNEKYTYTLDDASGTYLNEELAQRHPTNSSLKGTTMLNIAVGHQIDTIMYLLGEFSSISATTATLYPTATVVDISGKPTGDTCISTVSDHIAFSGKLKSGAVVSVTWRAGYSSTKGRKQFVWIIDGDDGSICLENDASKFDV